MRDSSLSPSSRLGGAVISDRIVSALLEELRTGRYAQTDRLPAEVDLAAELGVSRTVIRDALSEMERAGYIERVRGIGTVVNRSVLNLRSRLDQKLEYYPLIRSFGSYPHADGIQIYPVRAGEELARDLAIEPGDDVICIKKRILADTTPVIYSIDYLPRALFGNRDYTRIDLSGDVFDVLERECRQQVASNVAHLKASCGDERQKFDALFAPVKTTNTTDIPTHLKTIQQEWKKRGLSFVEDDKIRLVSVVLHDQFSETDNSLMIGHVGVMLPTSDAVYFVEKVAFQEPYRLLKFKNRTELSDYLMLKYDNSWGQDTAHTFIMENSDLMDGWRILDEQKDAS